MVTPKVDPKPPTTVIENDEITSLEHPKRKSHVALSITTEVSTNASQSNSPKKFV